MVRFDKLSAPSWSLLLFLFFFPSCGKVDTPNVADPFANITGKSLGFDVSPPFFELDASGNPKGLDAAVSGSCGKILLHWNRASDDVTLPDNISYFIYQSSSSGSENFAAPTYQVPAGVTQYLVTNLSPGTTYYFVVRARDEAGNLSVIDPNHLVERSAATAGTRGGGGGPNLYCPGGYSGETAVFTGTSVGSATTAIFPASPLPVYVSTTAISSTEIRAIIPSNIQSGQVQVAPPVGTATDPFLFFPPGRNISNDASSSSDPAIAVSGTNMAMAWADSYNGKGRILFSYSTNGGTTFTPPVPISAPDRFSATPHLSFGTGSSPPLYVVWSDLDAAGNNSDIYFSRSLNNGSSFSPPVNLSLNAGESLHPRVVSSGNTVSVVWDDNSVLYGLTSVWGSTLTDVYAVGKGGTIYHTADQGKTWLKQLSNTAVTLNGVWGSSATDVYAVGTGGTIVHFKGTAWATTPGISNTINLNAVWGSGPGDVYAVGTGGTILHYTTASGWISQTVGSANLNAVWGSGSGDVYAVGTGGTLLHYTPASGWTPQTQGTANLNAIWGSGSNDIYIAGDQGTLLYSTGNNQWTAQTTGIASGLNAIWGTTYLPSGTTVTQEVVYAGGAGDKIIKKSGPYPLSSATSWDPNSVAISGSFTVTGLWGLVIPGVSGITSNIYGAQGNGSIFQWNGSNWQYRNPETTSGEIFYLQSLDGGATFGVPIQVSSAYNNIPPHQALLPDLVQSGSNLTISWSESQSGIHLVQSPDNGACFYNGNCPQPLISPLQSSSFPRNPKLSLSGSNVYMVWEDTSQLVSQVRMTVPAFPVSGLSSFPSSRLLTTSGTAAHPSVTFVGNTLVVVWADTLQQKLDQNVLQDEIFLISSPDGGLSFTPPVNFSSPFQDSSDNPVLTNNGLNIFMAWQQQMPPVGSLPQNSEVFFSHF